MGVSLDIVAQLARAAGAHGFRLDPAQERAAGAFQRLAIELSDKGSLTDRLLGRRQVVRGVYLWGAVGRGKSFLMDEFFRVAPLRAKRRVHFHRFMRNVHSSLRELQGQVDPVRRIAERTAREIRMLCLDEFHVADIGDAMLMRGLLEGLFDRGVVLVATSNERPEELYLHGLQRAQFIPAIELLLRHTHVLELDGGQDYRLRALERAGVYHAALNGAARTHLEQAFEEVAGEHGEEEVDLDIEGRTLHARRLAPGVAWFDFQELCERPRGTTDYIELARRYHTVLIWGVPVFAPGMRESMRRFTWLVDEFYDRRVKMIIAAQAPAHELHASVPSAPDVERARSRLVEMQTAQYLSKPHLA